MDIQYKIIGGDGSEYGPATLDELRGWIDDGRVAGATQVWRSDLAVWAPASRYVELQPALTRLTASLHPAVVESAQRPAGFWARLAAYIVDRIALSLVMGIFWGPISTWKHWVLPVFPADLTAASYHQYLMQLSVLTNELFPYVCALYIIYDVLMNGRFGATLGKMLIGARIISIDGAPIGYARALLRSLASRLIEMTLLIGYFWIPLRPDKRGMHDFMAGTKVVYQ